MFKFYSKLVQNLFLVILAVLLLPKLLSVFPFLLMLIGVLWLLGDKKPSRCRDGRRRCR